MVRPRLGPDNRGAVAIIAALALTMLCGAIGLAIDVGLWYRTHRAMQNAADAAAIAAARDGTTSYQATGKAVAAQYGFVDGSGGITVTIANNQSCPSGNSTCYKASIDDAAAPQFFSKVLGFGAPPLSTAALVDLNAGSTTHNYCMLVLAQSGTNPGLLSNGGPKADMAHCGIYSNTDMTCNGHNLNADYGDSAGTNNGCGNVQNSGLPKINDPYAAMAAKNIPTNPCATYWHEPTSKGINSVPPGANTWLPVQPLPAATFVCGDLKLVADTVISNLSAPGAVVYIENGTLDLNGFNLSTAPGGGLTVVFTGTAGNYSPTPFVTGNGNLDITAPTSGTWSGVAIYQDPNLPASSLSYAGNSPTWNISGLVYMPHASLTFSGAVNKSSNGASCFVLVIDSIRINGTGAILSHGGCSAAGVNMPTATLGSGSPGLVM